MHVSHGRSGQPSEQRTATFTGTVHMDPVLHARGIVATRADGIEVPPSHS